MLLAFEAYLLVRWVSGPMFTAVPAGPTPMPGWQEASVKAGEALCLAGALVTCWQFVIRPVRRDGRLGLDGMLWIAMLLVSIYDPVSCYWQQWFGYNSIFLNRGTPLSGIPGWHSPQAPGSGIAFPLLFVPGCYVAIFVPMMIGGARLMARIRRARPSMPAWQLVLICLVGATVFEAALETYCLMPLGWYAEADIGFAVNRGHYYQQPIPALAWAGVFFTGLICLRYFLDDRGLTFAERGAYRAGVGKRVHLLRLLAVIGAVQVIAFACYHLPQAITMGRADTSMPDSIGSKSYYMNNRCGPGTAIACPPWHG